MILRAPKIGSEPYVRPPKVEIGLARIYSREKIEDRSKSFSYNANHKNVKDRKKLSKTA